VHDAAPPGEVVGCCRAAVQAGRNGVEHVADHGAVVERADRQRGPLQPRQRPPLIVIGAPILLALTTDRTILVVRRHVLGMRDDASPWAKLGRGLARLALYALRAVVDLKNTRRGVKAAILAAAFGARAAKNGSRAASIRAVTSA